MSDETGEAITLTVAGKQIRLRMEGGFGPESIETEIALDPKAEPKRIDFREVHSRDKGSTLSRNEGRSVGIYRLTGDTLTLCLTHESSGRPKDFTLESGHLLTFTRTKR